MKTITITQAQKPHHPNRMHDELIAAGVTPITLESTDRETRITVDDQVAGTAVQTVIDAHVKPEPETPFDWRAHWQGVSAAVGNAATLPQLKSAVVDLSDIVKEIVRERAGQLD